MFASIAKKILESRTFRAKKIGKGRSTKPLEGDRLGRQGTSRGDRNENLRGARRAYRQRGEVAGAGRNTP